jgi:hypothetical protein
METLRNLRHGHKELIILFKGRNLSPASKIMTPASNGGKQKGLISVLFNESGLHIGC